MNDSIDLKPQRGYCGYRTPSEQATQYADTYLLMFVLGNISAVDVENLITFVQTRYTGISRHTYGYSAHDYRHTLVYATLHVETKPANRKGINQLNHQGNRRKITYTCSTPCLNRL